MRVIHVSVRVAPLSSRRFEFEPWWPWTLRLLKFFIHNIDLSTYQSILIIDQRSIYFRMAVLQTDNGVDRYLGQVGCGRQTQIEAAACEIICGARRAGEIRLSCPCRPISFLSLPIKSPWYDLRGWLGVKQLGPIYLSPNQNKCVTLLIPSNLIFNINLTRTRTRTHARTHARTRTPKVKGLA